MDRANFISKSSSILSNASTKYNVNTFDGNNESYGSLSSALQLDDWNNKASGIDYRLNNLEQSLATFKDEFKLITETMNKLVETVNLFQSEAKANKDTSVILNNNQVKDIIDSKISDKIRFEISNNSVLAKVQRACYHSNPLNQSEFQSLQAFYNAWNMIARKFDKNEKADEEYRKSNEYIIEIGMAIIEQMKNKFKRNNFKIAKAIAGNYNGNDSTHQNIEVNGGTNSM
jgi:hypothetical protein